MMGAKPWTQYRQPIAGVLHPGPGSVICNEGNTPKMNQGTDSADCLEMEGLWKGKSEGEDG